jgi:DNA uptake protein ComE-like DNA-binding protein
MKAQRGFVLPLTLWILAAIAIAAAAFAEQMETALDLARLAQQRVDLRVDTFNTRAEILFRLATTPMSVYGLGTAPDRAVALDDRPYRGEGGDWLRLQDERGLLNLNLAGDDSIHRLLGALDIPYGQRDRMIDTLKDYIDEDGLRRLNGAEARDYAGTSLPPPRNAQLVTPYEARNILGWRDLPALWQNGGLAELATTGRAVGVNPNTAPWQVLITLPGVTAETAKRLIAARTQGAIQSTDQAALLMGVPGVSLILQVITFPGDSVRVTQGAPGQAWALRYNVSLTPNSEHAPWRVDYTYRIESPYPDVPIEPLPRLPEKSAPPAPAGAPLPPF